MTQTNQQKKSEALRPIARYKIGYHTDEWGMRSSSPSGIPDPAGAWVRYEDHVAALAAVQQPATSAAAPMAPILTDDQIEKVYSLMNRRLFEGKKPCYAEVRAMLAAPQLSPTPQADSQPAPVRCPACSYQHGHAIGCENNPVDISLAAQALVAARAPADSVLEDAARKQGGTDHE